MVTVIYEIGLEIWGLLPPKNITILARLRTSSQLDREYLRIIIIIIM